MDAMQVNAFSIAREQIVERRRKLEAATRKGLAKVGA